MKKFFVTLLFVLIFPIIVSAHSTVYDGEVGALLHIDPDDDPIISEPATLYFHWESEDSDFYFENCGCTIDILLQGKSLYSNSLELVSDKSFGNETRALSFTFPKKGLYVITVKGNALKDNTKTPFNLQYEVRVEREGDRSFVSHAHHYLGAHWLHWAVLGIAIIITAFIITRDNRRTKK